MAPDGRLKGGVIFVRRFAPGCAGIIAENALELFDLALLASGEWHRGRLRSRSGTGLTAPVP